MEVELVLLGEEIAAAQSIAARGLSSGAIKQPHGRGSHETTRGGVYPVAPVVHCGNLGPVGASSYPEQPLRRVLLLHARVAPGPPPVPCVFHATTRRAELCLAGI